MIGVACVISHPGSEVIVVVLHIMISQEQNYLILICCLVIYYFFKVLDGLSPGNALPRVRVKVVPKEYYLIAFLSMFFNGIFPERPTMHITYYKYIHIFSFFLLRNIVASSYNIFFINFLLPLPVGILNLQ